MEGSFDAQILVGNRTGDKIGNFAVVELKFKTN